MSEQRLRRRLAGYLRKRLGELHIEDVPDARDPRGKRWQLGTLLRAVLVGLAAGANGLDEVEDLTEQMTPEIRRWLQIPRRVPDTTLRDALVTIKPNLLPSVLHRAVRAAHRRKALARADMKMEDIAEHCGFSEARILYRNFRLITGISPARYRKNFR